MNPLQATPLLDYPLVTMLGRWPLTHPWVAPCIRSWARLHGSRPRILAVSDGTLDAHELQKAGLDDCIRFDPDGEARMESLLSRHDNLRRMRARDLTWRKILDVGLLYRDAPRLLLIDTDVLVREPVSIPDAGPLIYLREDIPAYQASPTFPWRVPIVRSFNAGFVLLDPAIIDLDFLDHLAARYFLKLKNPWWSEQAAWAALAGRQPCPLHWAGADACTLSGFQSRTADQIRRDVVRLFSSPKPCPREDFAALAGTAPVLHLAGLGKKNWDVFPLSPKTDATSPRPLGVLPDTPIGPAWRAALSLRLLIKSLRG